MKRGKRIRWAQVGSERTSAAKGILKGNVLCSQGVHSKIYLLIPVRFIEVDSSNLL